MEKKNQQVILIFRNLQFPPLTTVLVCDPEWAVRLKNCRVRNMKPLEKHSHTKRLGYIGLSGTQLDGNCRFLHI